TLVAGGRDGDRPSNASRSAALLRRQPEHEGNPRQFWRLDEGSDRPLLGRRACVGDAGRRHRRAHRARAGAQGRNRQCEARAVTGRLRPRDDPHDPWHAVARTAWRAAALPRVTPPARQVGAVFAILGSAVVVVSNLVFGGYGGGAFVP